MAGDRIDDLAAALFSAARGERPRDDVRERVLAAISDPRGQVIDESMLEAPSPAAGAAPVIARSRSPYGAAVAFALALAAVASGVVVFRGRGEPVFSIGPERSSEPNEAHPAPSLPKVENELSPDPGPPEPVHSKPAPARAAVRAAHDGSAAQRAESPTPASLPDEIAALDRARTALSSGDASGALRMLDDYERVLRGTRLTAEATLLRIDALARSGRSAEASTLASRFVEANPGSALADRARAFIKSSNLTRVDAGGSQ